MNLSYYFFTALRQISRRFLTFVCSTLIISVCILLVSCCILTGINLRRYMKDMLTQANFTVILQNDISEAEIDQLLTDIKALDSVADAVYNSKAVNYKEALEMVQAEQESFPDASGASYDFDAEEFFENEDLKNVLLDKLSPTIAVQLNDYNGLTDAVTSVRTLSGVKETRDPLQIIENLGIVSSSLDTALTFIIPCLACLSLFIVYSFIQMSLIARSEEIQIMSIVGAAPSFIRMPFLIEGAFLGFFGSSFALFAQYGIHRLVLFILKSTNMMQHFSTLLRFREILVYVVPGFLVTGTLMGLLCARIALHWLIRPTEQE